jgi:hypothetical protein
LDQQKVRISDHANIATFDPAQRTPPPITAETRSHLRGNLPRARARIFLPLEFQARGMGAHGDRLAAGPSPNGRTGAMAMNAAVIRVRIPRIVREPDAPGWLVILGSYGWLFSSRHEALSACRDLTVRQ